MSPRYQLARANHANAEDLSIHLQAFSYMLYRCLLLRVGSKRQGCVVEIWLRNDAGWNQNSLHRGCALSWLEKAYQDRSFFLTGIRFDPAMDPLRSDPRDCLEWRLGEMRAKSLLGIQIFGKRLRETFVYRIIGIFNSSRESLSLRQNCVSGGRG